MVWIINSGPLSQVFHFGCLYLSTNILCCISHTKVGERNCELKADFPWEGKNPWMWRWFLLNKLKLTSKGLNAQNGINGALNLPFIWELASDNGKCLHTCVWGGATPLLIIAACLCTCSAETQQSWTLWPYFEIVWEDTTFTFDHGFIV